MAHFDSKLAAYDIWKTHAMNAHRVELQGAKTVEQCGEAAAVKRLNSWYTCVLCYGRGR
jgi:hypothetical protein